MTQIQNNLINELKKLPEVARVEEYFSYVKIDTTCPIQYSNEMLTLYAKPIENKILITDLNTILEDADSCKVSPSTFKSEKPAFTVNSKLLVE